jgi:hypothetical protein
VVYFVQVLQERADKICEMAFVMQKSIEADEANYAKEHELMSRLITENKVSFSFKRNKQQKDFRFLFQHCFVVIFL